MNNIVTWEYYNSLGNKVKQGEFSKLEARAEKHVLSVIGQYRWNHVKESAFYFDQLRDCICKVMDMLVDFDRGSAGKGMSSVSNDGYSENYVVRTASEYDNEIRVCIMHCLSGTGLTSAFSQGG